MPKTDQTGLYIRNLIYAIAGYLNLLWLNSRPKLTVYCYHSIANDGWKYSVSESEFKKQVEFLLAHAKPFNPKDLQGYIDGANKLNTDAFLLTFDDGYQDILAVKEFLQLKNISPIAFVLSDTERANRAELETDRPFLSVSEITELQNAGWVIGSHSATHADFQTLKTPGVVHEIAESKQALEASIGSEVTLFAYPKGAYTPEAVEAVRNAGYAAAFSVNDGYVLPGVARWALPRVGVDGTHSMKQFKVLALPSSMLLRRVLRKGMALFAK